MPERKRKLSKRQKRQAGPRDQVLATANGVLRDIRLDVIGYDSCVLSTKLLHDRLINIGIRSKPVDCVAVATVAIDDQRTLTASLSTGDQPGHAVLFAEGLLVDLTVNQFNELDPRIPEISPIVAALPTIEDSVFSIELSPPGVHLEYFFDTNRTPFFLDSYDWLNPDLEASVLSTRRLIEEGRGPELRRLIRDRQLQQLLQQP